jgi:transposase
MRKKKPEALERYAAILSGQKNGKTGRPPLPRPPAQDLKRLYVREGRSIREIAGMMNMTRDTIRRALREAGIERRSRARRSRLRRVPIETIELTIREHKMKKAAAILGVGLRTLQDYRATYRDRLQTPARKAGIAGNSARKSTEMRQRG